MYLDGLLMDNTMTISEAFALQKKYYLLKRHKSAKTVLAYDAVLVRFVKDLGNIDIERLNEELVYQWQMMMEERGNSINTIRQYLVCLRGVIRFLHKRDIDVMKVEKIEMPEQGELYTNYLNAVEIRSLIKVLLKKSSGRTESTRNRDAAIVSLLYASGIRINECVNLDRDCFDNGSFGVMGKGKKYRPCFTDVRTDKLIRKYLELRRDNNPALFVANKTGERISAATIEFFVRTYGKKAGINKRVHPHIFRHSFATNLYLNKVHLIDIAKLLGHKSVITTHRYTHVVGDPALKLVYKKGHTV